VNKAASEESHLNIQEKNGFLKIFFLNRGRSRRTWKHSFTISGGVTTYIKDQKEKENYTPVLTICTEDPIKNLE
jgi:hypothetical protein